MRTYKVEKRGPLFLVKAFVEGAEGRAYPTLLLDTGSAYTLISLEILESIGCSPAVPKRTQRIITGSGYEVLVETSMPDSKKNRSRYIQFMAQEVRMDGRIPHLDKSGIDAVLKEARKRARQHDNKKRSLSLRLREMGGVIRAAGDIAISKKARQISDEHVKFAIERSMSAEEQIKDKYGHYQGGVMKEMSEKRFLP